MLIKTCFIVWIIIRLHICSAKQSFERSPEYQEVNPGDDVILTCKIRRKDKSSSCRWEKDELPIKLEPGKYEWKDLRDDGDCSLRIFNANLNYDDGSWQCQVTASSYDSGDALSSEPARLVVRVPPDHPRIFYQGQRVTTEFGLQIKADEAINLRCESRSGNPVAELRWFLDDQPLEGATQRNETENDKTINAISNIEIVFKHTHNNKTLKCRAFHLAYTGKVRDENVLLDVQYAPRVRLERNKDNLVDIEADVDNFEINCVADANPEPIIQWRKAGHESYYRYGSLLKFEPVRADDGGTYRCSAQNEIGRSDELSVTFNVLSEPQNIRIIPNSEVELEVGNKLRLECKADGNPRPEYEWIQKITYDKTQKEFPREKSNIINIYNVSYEHEGLWICQAKNRIKGNIRKVVGNPVRVDISGRPEVLDNSKSARVQHFPRQKDAHLQVVFCADPKPIDVYWEWDTTRISQGDTRNRYSALKIKNHRQNDCYLSTLIISSLESSDAKIYTFVTKNAGGNLKFPVRLEVTDPMAMAMLIGIAVACLVIFVLAMMITMCYCRSKKGCGKTKISDSERSFYPYTLQPPQTINRQTTSFPHPRDGGFYSATDLVLAHQKHKQEQQNRLNNNNNSSNDSSISNHSPNQSDEPDLIYRPAAKRQPTYPLPPTSHYPLNPTTNGSLIIEYSGGARPRIKNQPGKTPQNVDQISSSNATQSVYTDSPNSSAIVYTDLQLSNQFGGGGNILRRNHMNDVSPSNSNSAYDNTTFKSKRKVDL